MGKGTFDLKAEKIELRYQYAPKMKKHELFYKLLRLVTVVCEIWVKISYSKNNLSPLVITK